MKTQLNYAKIFMETVILTVAVAIIAAAVYFFLVPSHTSVSPVLESYCPTSSHFRCLRSR